MVDAPLTPARRRRTESIEDAIKDMVVRHGLKPGDRLPQERELMETFGASKGTVREAVSALTSQGLVVSQRVLAAASSCRRSSRSG